MENTNTVNETLIIQQKKCPKCNNDFPIENFIKGNKDCFNCRTLAAKIAYQLKKDNQKELIGTTFKNCIDCNQNKPIEMFKPGQNQCKDCINARRRELRNQKNPKIIHKVQEGNKYCKYCEVEKPEANFRHNRLKCTDCERSDGRNYRKSDYGKTKSLTWKDNNKDRMKDLLAKWFQNNKTEIYERIRERYKTDIKFKLRAVCSRRLRGALKKNGKSIMDFLNCSIPFLKMWFSFCYDENMTDDNHGSYWHIDHVIPIGTFQNLVENETERRLCFSWFNLSPLEASVNMSKHDSINKIQLKKHIEALKEYAYIMNVDYEKDLKEYEQLCAKHLDAGNSLETLTTTP